MQTTDPTRALKVLVVDDDRSVRDVLRIAFSLEDGVAEVRSAGDGREAVTVVREFEPDVIVLDQDMPAMSGSDAAVEIRKIAPSARIVAFSGALDTKPSWADEHFVKGSVADLAVVIRLPDVP